MTDKLRNPLTRDERESYLRMLDDIETGVDVFDDLSIAAVRSRKAAALADIDVFIQTYLPQMAWVPSCDIHRDIDSDFRPEHPTLTVRVVPGGYGKTARARCNLLHEILYKDELIAEALYFAGVICMTLTETVDWIEFVRANIAHNPRILSDFGDLRSIDNWRAGDIQTTNKCRIVALSLGTKVRQNWNNQRFQRLIADDIETAISVQNVVIQERHKNWFLERVFSALDLDTKSALNIYGNWLSDFSSLALLTKHIQDDPDYLSSVHAESISSRAKVYTCRTPSGDPTWPEKFPNEKLDAIEATIGTTAFLADYMNITANDHSVFNPDWFLDWPRDTVRIADVIGPVYAAVDPSFDEAGKGCMRAIIAVMACTDGKARVVWSWIRHASDDNMVAAMFACYDHIKNTYGISMTGMGFEFIGGAILFLRDIRAAEIARSQSLPIIKIVSHKLPKPLRIEGLARYIERGVLLFDREHHDGAILYKQLIAYGTRGVYLDGPDALEMAFSLCQFGGQRSQSAAAGAGNRQFTGERFTAGMRGGRIGF